MTTFVPTIPTKADTIEIQKTADGYKVLVIKDDVVQNFYKAQDQGIALGIARKQMERL